MAAIVAFEPYNWFLRTFLGEKNVYLPLNIYELHHFWSFENIPHKGKFHESQIQVAVQ